MEIESKNSIGAMRILSVKAVKDAAEAFNPRCTAKKD